MKAIVYRKYGSPDVLELVELEKPVPKDNEVLIEVYASSVNPYDWRSMRADPFIIRFGGGMFKPKDIRLGADVAGRVVEVGSKVKQFKIGDDVYGICTGAFAEYVCVAEDRIALKPDNMTFEEAAAVPMAAITALQSLRDKGKVTPEQKVLVNGASGGVGTYAVQIAKSLGAIVTGVCSTSKLDLVRSLGADHVIDYKKEDFTKNGQRYDLIVDAAAYHSLADYKRALTPQGRYIFIGGAFTIVFKIMLSKKENFEVLSAKVNQKDFIFISELIEEGKVKSVIDKAYPLSQTAEAVRYLESGQARGKVVITVK